MANSNKLTKYIWRCEDLFSSKVHFFKSVAELSKHIDVNQSAIRNKARNGNNLFVYKNRYKLLKVSVGDNIFIPPINNFKSGLHRIDEIVISETSSNDDFDYITVVVNYKKYLLNYLLEKNWTI